MMDNNTTPDEHINGEPPVSAVQTETETPYVTYESLMRWQLHWIICDLDSAVEGFHTESMPKLYHNIDALLHAYSSAGSRFKRAMWEANTIIGATETSGPNIAEIVDTLDAYQNYKQIREQIREQIRALSESILKAKYDQQVKTMNEVLLNP